MICVYENLDKILIRFIIHMLPGIQMYEGLTKFVFQRSERLAPHRAMPTSETHIDSNSCRTSCVTSHQMSHSNIVIDAPATMSTRRMLLSITAFCLCFQHFMVILPIIILILGRLFSDISLFNLYRGMFRIILL